MKKALIPTVLVLVSILVSCLILEIILTGYNLYNNGVLSRQNLVKIRESVHEENLGPTVAGDPNRQWENNLVIHPFFGYVHNPKLPNTNNFGFRSKYTIDLDESGLSVNQGDGDDQLIVGIFGGSFADGVGFYGEYLEEKLSVIFPKKKLVVLNFGMGGWALPQSFFSFVYFRELLDIAVFIDGLNEVWNAVENNNVGVPPDYAKAAHFQYKLSLSELSPERFNFTSQIIRSKKTLGCITNASLLPLLRRSILVHFTWRSFAKYLQRDIATKSVKIRQSYMTNRKYIDVADEFIINHAVRQWKRYHRLIHEISIVEDIVDIHLLQPNPFVAGSKNLTEDELAKSHQPYNDNIRRPVEMGYPSLRKEMASFKDAGFVAEDLVLVYQDNKQSIWVDPAHPNKVGYKIVIDKLSKIIDENRSRIRFKTD